MYGEWISQAWLYLWRNELPPLGSSEWAFSFQGKGEKTVASRRKICMSYERGGGFSGKIPWILCPALHVAHSAFPFFVLFAFLTLDNDIVTYSDDDKVRNRKEKSIAWNTNFILWTSGLPSLQKVYFALKLKSWKKSPLVPNSSAELLLHPFHRAFSQLISNITQNHI